MDITKHKWAVRMLKMAKEVASWSKDQSTKVGAVITTKEGAPVSWGFNGLAMGINDDIPERHTRPTKYKWMCHAERNAMDLAPRPLDDCIMFVTFSPCSSCAQSIIQRKIKTVIVDSEYTADKVPPHWRDDMIIAVGMLMEAGVKVSAVDIIDESK
jgi:dCMP deaminase